MFGKKISASGLILFITLLLAVLAGTWLFTAGPGGVNRALPTTCQFHPATSLAGNVVVKIGSSVNADLPAWAEPHRSDFDKLVAAITAGDLESAAARFFALKGDVNRSRHSLNELGGVFVAKLIAATAAAWLANNLLPFIFAMWGMLLLWLLHRAWWSPLSIFRWLSRFAGGLLIYYAIVFAALATAGVILRIWLGEYLDLIIRVTEGLIWSSVLLAVGLICSVGGGTTSAAPAAAAAPPPPPGPTL